MPAVVYLESACPFCPVVVAWIVLRVLQLCRPPYLESTHAKIIELLLYILNQDDDTSRLDGLSSVARSFLKKSSELSGLHLVK